MSNATYWEIGAIGKDGRQYFFGCFDRERKDDFVQHNRQKYEVLMVALYKDDINVGLTVYKNGKLIFQY